MNTKIMKIVFLFFSGITTLFLCTTSDPVLMAGNSSQTPNALVGMLYGPDGRTPAQGVKVEIRPKNTLALSGGNGTSLVRTDTASTVTDNSGWFAFDTCLAAGMYVIEASSGVNAVLIDSIQIVKDSTTDTLPADTLKPAGAIRGVVKLIGGGDPSDVYVLAFGINRYTEVRNDGSFLFAPLAEGKYDLRLITSLQDYTKRDTFDNDVVAAETTDIGVLELPYTGFPVPSAAKLFYDSATQQVTVSWNRDDTSIVKEYLITRKFNWGSRTYNNSFNIEDTFFTEKIDVTNEATWLCNISGVGEDGIVGTESDTLRFTWAAKTLETVSQSIILEQLSDSICIKKDKDDNIWVADYGTQKLWEYDRNGILKTSWPVNMSKGEKYTYSRYYSYLMAIDLNKNIIVENDSLKSIVKYDSTGSLIGTAAIIDTNHMVLIDLFVDPNGYIYAYLINRFGLRTSWIKKFDKNLTLLESFGTPFDIYNHTGIVIVNNVFAKTITSGYFQKMSDINRISVLKSKQNNYGYQTIKGNVSTIDNGLIYGIDDSHFVWETDSLSLHQDIYSFSSGMQNDSDRLVYFETMNNGTFAIGFYNNNSRTCTIHFFRRPK